MHDLIESNGKLVSKLENDKCELKQQVEQLQKELSKTQKELSNCQKEFCEHKVSKRKKEDSYLNDIVDLDAKLKVFEKTACDKSLIESENLRVENGMLRHENEKILK